MQNTWHMQGFSGFPLEENLLQQPNTHGDKYTSRSEGYHQSSCVHTHATLHETLHALERAWRLQLFSKHLMISKQTLPVYTRSLLPIESIVACLMCPISGP